MGVIVLNGKGDKRCGHPRRMAKRMAVAQLSSLNSRGLVDEKDTREFNMAMEALKKSSFTFVVSDHMNIA